MTRCPEVLANLHSYVDGELAPALAIELEAHLLDCTACRAEYETLRSVVDTVRGARPMYEPRPEFAARMASIVVRPRWRNRLTLTAVATIVTAGFVGLMRLGSGPSPFVAHAATAHVRFAQGKMPLDFVSSDAALVTDWLNRRLSFQLSLPAAPPGDQLRVVRGAAG